MIGKEGENLGVMSREEALALARADEGLDLIEISPTAVPPVVRLMSFDKWRYLQEKALKKERLAQKVGGIKKIQITPRSAKNDLLIRLKKLEEFLAEDYQVEIEIKLRGREKGNKEWALLKLNEFLGMITTEYRLISPPRFGGRGAGVQIIKKK